MSTKFHSADGWSLLLGGLSIGKGKGNDTWLEIEALEESISVVVGVDGEVTICENRNTTHVVNVHLMSTSEDNAILSAIKAVGDATLSGAVVPGAIKNTNGTSLLGALDVVIAGWPKETVGKEAQPVVWKLFFLSPKRFVGGNSGT